MSDDRRLIDYIEDAFNYSRQPLSAEDILRVITKYLQIQLNGKTPTTAIRARLSQDIEAHGERSRFARFARGKYGLRKWLHKYPEKYTEFNVRASRDLRMEEDLAVFDRELLSQLSIDKLKFTSIPTEWFRENCFSLRRREAENDDQLVQLVSVFLIRYQNKILTHVRAGWAPESRLHGEKSVHLGGHINYEEIFGLFDPFDTDSDYPWVLRELFEEIDIKDDSKLPKIKTIGLLYDDSRDVSKQHLGLCYLVDLLSDDFSIGEKGYHIDAELIDKNEIKIESSTFENWSRILISELEEIEKL